MTIDNTVLKPYTGSVVEPEPVLKPYTGSVVEPEPEP